MPPRKATPVPDHLDFRPVDEATVGDFESLFDGPGGPRHCWCMVWRRSAAEAKANDPASRRRQMMQRIAAGTPVGLVAYGDGQPIGWVSVAPRETYRNLGGPEAKAGESIWSIACFYVPRQYRGQGMVRRLIAAAIAHASVKGQRWSRPIRCRQTRRAIGSWGSWRSSPRRVSGRSARPGSGGG